MRGRNEGGPAYPQFELVAGERDGHGDIIEAYTVATGGMSLRDWLAGQALPAVMSRMHEDIQHLGSETFPTNVAAHAYRIADAMLEERNK